MDIKTVGVVGGGTMGAEIAFVAASRLDASIIIKEADDKIIAKSRDVVGRISNRTLRRKEATEEDLAAWSQKICWTTRMEDLAGAQVIVEAVFENMDLKKQVFADLDSLCPPQTLLCTNTSALPVTEIASLTKHPERVIGTHFFNPAAIMKLVEIVRGLATSDETVERTKAFCQSLGKETVVCKDSPGFITSRLATPVMLEAMKCVQEGIASAEDIDKAMRLAYNHPIGPLELADLVGLDTMLRVMDGMQQSLGEHFRPPTILRQMVAAGRLGRKVGKGFYDYAAK
ncbi:MAG: 3-hydroxyacyl-CoA dehydrogenase family protein [Chloroflexi bacterium]|nr:3-hydroxyacyl-CoA dehydrogenase family protein [Chloroflexota bacterium]